MAEKEYPHRNLTEAIIGCAYDVFNVLGHGFLEKVYENALALKIKSKGLVEGKTAGAYQRYL